VLCVHPPGDGPEIAYEAGMIRDDTRCALVPVLTEAQHPALRRLAQFTRRGTGAGPEGLIGEFLILEIERSGFMASGAKAAFPGWDVLRVSGGEIAELSAFARDEQAVADEPVIVSGRFEQGGLFQITFLPRGTDPKCRLTVVGRLGRVELMFPTGLDGPCFLNGRGTSGDLAEEYWEAYDPYPALISAFEATVAGQAGAVAWQDTVRALELDDAVRRSLSRRRTSLLEYPEATEEVGFKGTMTLVGCGVLWLVLLLAILAAWFPLARRAIVPLLVVFLSLQLLRYALPKRPPG
jgi:hypothetical protein